MSKIDAFIEAVSKRKAWNEKRNQINAAIVIQLQEDDIPRMLEIIRLLSIGMTRIKMIGDDLGEDLSSSEAVDMWQEARGILLSAENLAAEGNLNHWGEAKPLN